MEKISELGKFINNRYHFSIICFLLFGSYLITMLFGKKIDLLFSPLGFIGFLVALLIYGICMTFIIFNEVEISKKKSEKEAKDCFNNRIIEGEGYYVHGNGWKVHVVEGNNELIKYLIKDNMVVAKEKIKKKV